MTDPNTDSTTVDKTENANSPENTPTMPSGNVLAGANSLFDGKIHVGCSIEVAADGKVSHVMISDVTNIKNGAPIFITAPVRLKMAKLKSFLEKKGVGNIPKEIDDLLDAVSVSCEAFYFSTKKAKIEGEAAINEYIAAQNISEDDDDKLKKEQAIRTALSNDSNVETGPLLMMFEIKMDGGLIETLTKDPDLGALFDINAITLRVLRCPASKKNILVDYVRLLP